MGSNQIQFYSDFFIYLQLLTPKNSRYNLPSLTNKGIRLALVRVAAMIAVLICWIWVHDGMDNADPMKKERMRESSFILDANLTFFMKQKTP